MRRGVNHQWYLYLGGGNVLIISMMLTCDASVVVGCDRKRSRLCNTQINKKYDNYRTEI